MLLLASCGGTQPDVTTPAETETQAVVTSAEEDTTPQTFVPVIETGEIVSPETPTTLRIVYSETSLKYEELFSADNFPVTNPLKIRDSLLKSNHGVTFAGFKAASITNYVTSLNGAGADDSDFILVEAKEGIKLMLRGDLQDMSEAGINITGKTNGVNSALTDPLSFDGRVSLIYCNALTSDISSTYCLALNTGYCAADSAAVTEKIVLESIDGKLTCDGFLTLVSEIKTNDDCSEISVPDSGAALACIVGAGGRVFTSGSNKLPVTGFTSSDFSKAYNAGINLKAKSANGTNGVFTVKKIGDVTEGEGILPIPKISVDVSYRSYTDIFGTSVLAAPNGVNSGRRTLNLFMALCEASENVRTSYMEDIANKSAQNYSLECVKTIVLSECPELAACYGWGNLDVYFASGLLNESPLSDLISAKTCNDRLKTATAAIKIISDQLKNR